MAGQVQVLRGEKRESKDSNEEEGNKGMKAPKRSKDQCNGKRAIHKEAVTEEDGLFRGSFFLSLALQRDPPLGDVFFRHPGNLVISD